MNLDTSAYQREVHVYRPVPYIYVNTQYVVGFHFQAHSPYPQNVPQLYQPMLKNVNVFNIIIIRLMCANLVHMLLIQTVIEWWSRTFIIQLNNLTEKWTTLP